jgi:hypothetical protein
MNAHGLQADGPYRIHTEVHWRQLRDFAVELGAQITLFHSMQDLMGEKAKYTAD